VVREYLIRCIIDIRLLWGRLASSNYENHIKLQTTCHTTLHRRTVCAKYMRRNMRGTSSMHGWG